MKPLYRCFGMFLRQIAKDSMLYAILAAPVLAGCFFHYAIPYAESLLCAYFGKTAVLAGYYLLFDLLLAVITPYMFCFAASMVILTELDEHMTAYIAVTPVGRRGYLISRLAFPAAISFVVSVILMALFTLTSWTIPDTLLVCLLTGLLSVAVCLLLVSYSHNRVEGMALAKISGILMLGLPVPFFLFSDAAYLFSLLPSFWIAKLYLGGSLLPAMPAVLTSLLWMSLFYRKFTRKLS